MGNRYDELYNFRLAKVSDVERIMQFIHDEWGENHIFAHDRELFLWQYGRSEYGNEEDINFVLMEDKSGNLVGIIGYVLYSDDEENKHISPAMTMIKPNGMLPLSGLEFMKRQMGLVKEKEHFSHGTNPETIKPLYDRVFHMRTGVMQQYYMLNDKIDEFRIAHVENKTVEEPADGGITLEEFENIEDAEFDFSKTFDRMSNKSVNFINKRYFMHPIYVYKKWRMIGADGNTAGLLFGREISLFDRTILRIVDFRGELDTLFLSGMALKKLIIENKYEYIDIMVDDLPKESMRKCGFNLLDLDGPNIIPNYFEPFVLQNITDNYQNSGDIVMFKADGDQDRPNRRP